MNRLFLFFTLFIVAAGCSSSKNGNTTTTSEPGWQEAELLDTGSSEAQGAQIATDGRGNALVVWYQQSGARNDIWSSWYLNGRGWQAPELVETDDTTDAEFPKLAMDPFGNATVVWIQVNGSAENLYASRYTIDGGWGTPELLAADTTGEFVRQTVAADGFGNVIAVWSQSDGTNLNIWTNRFRPDYGWGAEPQQLNGDNGQNADYPSLAMNFTGQGLTTWTQSDGTFVKVQGARFSTDFGWSGTGTIDNVNQNADVPQPSVDPNGNEFVVWQQSNGTVNNIWVSRLNGVDPELLETDESNDAFAPRIQSDQKGNAVAVWIQDNGTGHDVKSNRYLNPDNFEAAPPPPTPTPTPTPSPTPVSNWSATPETVSESTFENGKNTLTNGEITGLGFSMNSVGDGVAGWTQTDGTRFNMWGNIFDGATGWATATLLEELSDGDSGTPLVAIDNNGHAFVIWTKVSGSQQGIWATHYVP